MHRPLTVVAAFAAAVLLLAAGLPAPDHHQAERTPGHAHIVLAGGTVSWTAEAGHRHGFEHSHAHVDGEPAPNAAAYVGVVAVSAAAPLAHAAAAPGLATVSLAPVPALPAAAGAGSAPAVPPERPPTAA